MFNDTTLIDHEKKNDTDAGVIVKSNEEYKSIVREREREPWARL